MNGMPTAATKLEKHGYIDSIHFKPRFFGFKSAYAAWNVSVMFFKTSI